MSEYHKIQQERHEAIAKINQEFDKRLRLLQESCPHTNTTGWLADGNHERKLCALCMEVVLSRSRPLDLSGKTW